MFMRRTHCACAPSPACGGGRGGGSRLRRRPPTCPLLTRFARLSSPAGGGGEEKSHIALIHPKWMGKPSPESSVMVSYSGSPTTLVYDPTILTMNVPASPCAA